ncbi:hypothetical protein CHS0354_012513 [Potamilus streckersoni]|uniref:SRCR domain-containing protein n=1 Tax=Potamilus streckersoni TaxID=2493646 RepID=A0AAE0SWI7_9BIVA|nr:hypothetical protein CHS0354_012513 [Potamilus streckersoni]
MAFPILLHFPEETIKHDEGTISLDMAALVTADQFDSVSTSSLRIWLDDVTCFGTESSLSDCSHRTWGDNNCRHSEDVAITCGDRFNQINAVGTLIIQNTAKHHIGKAAVEET